MSENKDKPVTIKAVIVITLALILLKFSIIYAHCINMNRVMNYAFTRIMSI